MDLIILPPCKHLDIPFVYSKHTLDRADYSALAESILVSKLPMKFVITSLLVLVSVFPAWSQVSRQERGESRTEAAIQVLSSSEQGVVIRITNLLPQITRIAGITAVTTNLPGHTESDSGSLPTLRFEIAVPHDAEGFTATLTPEASGSTYPVALDAGMNASRRVGVTTGTPVLRRGFRVVPVYWAPFSIEGSGLGYSSNVRITVTWKGGRRAAGVAAGKYNEGSRIESILASSILNFSSARAWYRGTPIPAAGIQSASASGWGMGQAMVLAVPHNGIYRISGAELEAAGAAGIVGVPVDRLGMTLRKQPVPFHLIDNGSPGIFDRDDAIEFFGSRFKGKDGFYYSEVTDTNAYILRWDGSVTSARVLQTVPAGEPAVVTSYDSTLHFEADDVYYGGATQPAPPFGSGDVLGLHVSERVPMERFYWQISDSRAELRYPFECSPEYLPGGTTTMRIMFAGVTNTHRRIVVSLNEHGEVGVVEFTGQKDSLFTFTFPTTLLVNGRNFLKLFSNEPGDMAKLTYLDYFSLTGRWQTTVTSSAEPRLTLPSTLSGQARIELTGLRSPVSSVISSRSRGVVEGNERGYLVKLTSRNDVPRILPGFVAEGPSFTVATPAFAGGIMLIELDRATGDTVRSMLARTHASAGQDRIAAFEAAAKFLGDTRNGNLIAGGFSIGIGDESGATQQASSFRNAMISLGSTAISRGDLGVSAWTFVVEKGNPASMQERFGSRLENMGGIVQTRFLSAANGSSYRASLLVDATPGEQIQIGVARAPALRYHGEDVLTPRSNSAEMVIITHPKFAAEARRLATYRTMQDNLATTVVDVFTIYDEFNDGIKSSEAIRDFLQYADSNWASPKPGFVLLFGDGTWDPMKRNVESIMDDYVPTFGIPASDYLYTVPKRDSVFFGNEDLEWRQMIGRLPAITTGDARAMVDKLIEYDTLSPAAWNKRFVFLAGGDEADPNEIPRNISHYQRMSEYVVGPLFGGDTALVVRTSPDAQQPSSGDAARARAEINRGAMWVSFSGHGSTNVVDLDFGYPEDLDIGNRYLVLGTFSCRTGDFAVPGVKPRNEYFMTAPGAGSVATIGSTGYSYSDINKKIETRMFAAMTSRPYQTNLGAIFTNSVKQVFDSEYYGHGPFTPEGTRYRNHLTSYTLLGDPSMNLVLSDSVELALPSERTSFLSESGRELNPSDSVTVVTAQLWNHGRPVLEDSVVVVATIISPTREETSDTVVVYEVSRYRELTFRLPLMQQPGEYTIRIEADPQGRFNETERRDNLLVLSLPVRGNQHLSLEPVPFGRVASYDNVVIHLLNPATGPGADIIVDTTADFSSASPISSRTTGSIDRAELTTTWTFSIPSQWRSARTFWYRAIATTGDPDAAARFPLIESFTVDNAPAAEFVLSGEKQMGTVELVNLVNDASGVGPGSRVVTLEVRSMGQTRFDNGALIPNRRVEFRADRRNIVSGNRSGINLVVLPAEDVIPITTGAFAFYDTRDWQRFADFVRDSIRVGDRVLMAANGVSFDYPDSVTNAELRAAVLGALEAIGVANPESIYPDDSYAMIGGKGLPPSMVRFTRLIARELKAAGQEPPYDAVVTGSFSAVARQGYLATPTIGPATAWRSLTLGSAENGLVPDLTIFGLRRDGLRDSLMRSDGAGRIDLASIDPLVYPRIDLRADFQSDTSLRLRSITVDFDPSPELALLPSSVRLEKDSVLQGDRGVLRYRVVNLSRRFAAHGITVRLSDVKVDDLVTIDSTILSLIPASGAVDTVFEINTARMLGHNRLALNANPTDNPSEPYRQNNSLGSGVLRVGVDKEAPSVAVYADGNRLMYGDFVAPGATFEFRIFDNSRLKIDSSSIQKLIFDNEVIVAGSNGLLRFSGGGESGPRGTFFYKPPQELESGEHGIIVHSVDASGNIDISEVITFTVERDLRLAQVVNVPNPFAERTVFTFMVAGTSQPTGGEIGIFTLAGRKVRTIPLSPVDLRIGFNRIEWNGLDEDGDRMANGVYFYRLRVDEGDRRQEILEKLVIMR